MEEDKSVNAKTKLKNSGKKILEALNYTKKRMLKNILISLVVLICVILFCCLAQLTLILEKLPIQI